MSYFLAGDFNSEPTEETMESNCQITNLANLVKEPTCYENPGNPLLTDLFLKNNSSSLQNPQFLWNSQYLKHFSKNEYLKLYGIGTTNITTNPIFENNF